MKKMMLLFLCCYSLTIAQAQSIRDVVRTGSKVIGAVTDAISVLQLDGTWKYKGSAVAFQSDNLLMKAGGAAVAHTAESNLNEQLARLGITEGSSHFVFSEGHIFKHTIGRETLSGTFTYDEQSGILTLKYMRFFPLKAHVSGNAKKMELLFQADSFLKMLGFFGNLSSNSAIQAITSLIDRYEGMMIGFALEKE